MGLLQVLKSNADVRRLFGQRELAIVEKQLLGVSLKQSEKNRLSRDIRPKLKAIASLSRFEFEFGLKKGSEIKKWVSEATEAILQSRFFPRIKKVVLFGSTVENNRSLRSDIDLAVEFDQIGSAEAMQFRKEIGGVVNQRIIVQVLNVLPQKVVQEVHSKGRVLFERANQKQNPRN